MSNPKILPSQEYLNQCFLYQEDGILLWKERPASHYKTPFGHTMSKLSIGKFAGCRINKGYYVVGISYFGKQILCALHRVIWTMHYGEIPTGYLVDHKDTNPSNNRIDNLRLATYSNNSHNANLRTDNTSGFKGVAFCKRYHKWYADVYCNSKNNRIGYFSSMELAVEAVEAARLQLHKEFANHG
jgi:hypothetical protein